MNSRVHGVPCLLASLASFPQILSYLEVCCLPGLSRCLAAISTGTVESGHSLPPSNLSHCPIFSETSSASAYLYCSRWTLLCPAAASLGLHGFPGPVIAALWLSHLHQPKLAPATSTSPSHLSAGPQLLFEEPGSWLPRLPPDHLFLPAAVRRESNCSSPTMVLLELSEGYCCTSANRSTLFLYLVVSPVFFDLFFCNLGESLKFAGKSCFCVSQPDLWI